MNTNLPKKVNNNFFVKIRSWFKKNILKNSANIEVAESNFDTELQQDKRQESTFINDITKKTNIEATRLQAELEEGKIKASELSNEQYEEVVSLYETQIDNLESKLILAKQKLECIKGGAEE